jgi:hypothetical protein
MSDLPKSVIYRAKKAVEAAVKAVDAWADMADGIYIGMANLDMIEGLQLRIAAAGMTPNAIGPSYRGWNGSLDLIVCTQGDDTDPADHAEWCARIAALVTEAPADMDTRIENAACGVRLHGATGGPASDGMIEGLMATRYSISGLWTLAEEA